MLSRLQNYKGFILAENQQAFNVFTVNKSCEKIHTINIIDSHTTFSTYVLTWDFM